MSETLTFTPEQTTEPSVEAIEGLAQLALQGATSAAERGAFPLTQETEAELRALFDSVDPSAPELPLSAHGLGCDKNDQGTHVYLLPGYRPIAE